MKNVELQKLLQGFPQPAEVRVKVGGRSYPITDVEMVIPSKPIKMTTQNLNWNERVSDLIEAHLVGDDKQRDSKPAESIPEGVAKP